MSWRGKAESGGNAEGVSSRGSSGALPLQRSCENAPVISSRANSRFLGTYRGGPWKSALRYHGLRGADAVVPFILSAITDDRVLQGEALGGLPGTPGCETGVGKKWKVDDSQGTRGGRCCGHGNRLGSVPWPDQRCFFNSRAGPKPPGIVLRTPAWQPPHDQWHGVTWWTHKSARRPESPKRSP